VANANQTLTSGKLNEVVDLFIRQIDLSSRCRYKRRIEAESPLGTDRFGLLDGALDAGEDQLPGGTSFASGSLAQAAMQIARQVDAGANGMRLSNFHSFIVTK